MEKELIRKIEKNLVNNFSHFSINSVLQKQLKSEDKLTIFRLKINYD